MTHLPVQNQGLFWLSDWGLLFAGSWVHAPDLFDKSHLRFQSFHLLQSIWKVICWRSVRNVLTCLFGQSRRFNGAEEHRLRDLYPCKSQTAAIPFRATLALCFLLSPPHRSCSRGLGGDDGVACRGLIWNKQNDRTYLCYYFLKKCNASDDNSWPGKKKHLYDSTDHLMIILSSKAQGPLYLTPPPSQFASSDLNCPIVTQAKIYLLKKHLHST